MDDTPRQFLNELKSTILGRRIGEIALAVILAQECIRYLSTIVWNLIIPAIANVLQTHTESLLFQTRRTFNWEPLAAATVELITAVIFVFYVNRWIYGRHKPRLREHLYTERQPANEVVPQDEDYEPIVPRLLSAREAPKPELATAGGEHGANPIEEN